MSREVYEKIIDQCWQPAAREKTIQYLAEHLGKFLRKEERVLICFRCREEGSLSWYMEQAVLRCGAVPVVWGPDCLWKTLLRQAFANKVTAIIGPPLILLGLMKLKRYSSIPLYIRRVITAGYPCPDWMIEGLVKGFDCEVGGCFGLEHSGIVAGFACGKSWGVHLRSDVFGVEVVDAQGLPVPEGTQGEVVIWPKDAPQLRLPLGDYATMLTEPCSCGSTTTRLSRMCYGGLADPDLDALAHELLSWTSILDCHLKRGECGLEIEIVCFQGEKLPPIPTAARLLIRHWNPQADEPLPHASSLKFLDTM